MKMYANGRGTAILPPSSTTKVITGASLAHLRLSKMERAILAADVIDGLARYIQTHKEVAAAFDVSQPYVDAARRLSPEKREAIRQGWDSTSFAMLVKPAPQLQLRLPAPNCASITNTMLKHVIRAVGVDRTLEVAAQVESNI